MTKIQKKRAERRRAYSRLEGHSAKQTKARARLFAERAENSIEREEQQLGERAERHAVVRAERGWARG